MAFQKACVKNIFVSTLLLTVCNIAIISASDRDGVGQSDAAVVDSVRSHAVSSPIEIDVETHSNDGTIDFSGDVATVLHGGSETFSADMRGNSSQDILASVQSPDRKGISPQRTMQAKILSLGKAFTNHESEKFEHQARLLASEMSLPVFKSLQGGLDALKSKCTNNPWHSLGIHYVVAFVATAAYVWGRHALSLYANGIYDNIVSPFTGESIFEDPYLSARSVNYLMYVPFVSAAFMAPIMHVVTAGTISDLDFNVGCAQTTYDIGTQICPLHSESLKYSIDHRQSGNALIAQMYPQSHGLRINRVRSENSLGATQRGIANLTVRTIPNVVSGVFSAFTGIFSTPPKPVVEVHSSASQMQAIESVSTPMRDLGRMNLRRLELKELRRKPLTDAEQQDLSAVRAFPLYRHEMGLIRIANHTEKGTEPNVEPTSWWKMAKYCAYGPKVLVKLETPFDAAIYEIDQMITQLSGIAIAPETPVIEITPNAAAGSIADASASVAPTMQDFSFTDTLERMIFGLSVDTQIQMKDLYVAYKADLHGYYNALNMYLIQDLSEEKTEEEQMESRLNYECKSFATAMQTFLEKYCGTAMAPRMQGNLDVQILNSHADAING